MERSQAQTPTTGLPEFVSLRVGQPGSANGARLCEASHLQRVQEEICTHPVSRGSFSEAQHVLDPELLEALLQSLMAESSGPVPKDPHGAWQDWLARDSSIFPALSRMVWARYGCGKAGRVNNAVRLHVSFNLFDEKPSSVAVTAGRECERISRVK